MRFSLYMVGPLAAVAPPLCVRSLAPETQGTYRLTIIIAKVTSVDPPLTSQQGSRIVLYIKCYPQGFPLAPRTPTPCAILIQERYTCLWNHGGQLAESPAAKVVLLVLILAHDVRRLQEFAETSALQDLAVLDEALHVLFQALLPLLDERW